MSVELAESVVAVAVATVVAIAAAAVVAAAAESVVEPSRLPEQRNLSRLSYLYPS